jgi:flagella basal body P-ring formation protein FlgA
MLTLISILLIALFDNSHQLETHLKNYLDSKLKSYSKYEYQIMNMPKSYSKIEINNEKEFRINKNYGYIPISIYSGKNSVSASLLTLRLKLYKEVLVAQAKIERNVCLQKEMFVSKIENVTSVDGYVFEVGDEINLFRSKSIIREGSILTKEMMDRVPLVKIGDKVIMHTGKNGVDVTADVISRQEGVEGSLINVQCGGAIYKAKILDKYNLRLEE